MKLPIKKKYFDLIKSGKKKQEYRDSHITFVCEETGEELRKEIIGSCFVSKLTAKRATKHEFDDQDIIVFYLEDN